MQTIGLIGGMSAESSAEYYRLLNELVRERLGGHHCAHDVIYQELTQGRAEESSRAAYRRVMAGLAERGAQGIIYGCTEIPLLVGPEDSPVPVFDSTRIHVEHALDLAL